MNEQRSQRQPGRQPSLVSPPWATPPTFLIFSLSLSLTHASPCEVWSTTYPYTIVCLYSYDYYNNTEDKDKDEAEAEAEDEASQL
jgi:Ca2+/Na+ antiporter